MDNITLDKWMMHVWLPLVSGAKKYKMLQKLNDFQAREIMHMIADSAEFDMDSMSARTGPLYHGHPYRDSLGGYLSLLVESGEKDKNKWRKKLWRVLPDVDKMMLQKYARQVYNFDIKEMSCVR